MSLDGRDEVVVASHQPDLFPHTGFWYKMAHSNIFDLALHDQFQMKGYQRRVTMRGHWASVRLLQKKAYCPIIDLKVDAAAGSSLWDVIRGRYESSRFWSARQLTVHDWLEKAFVNDHLWMVNTSLIQSVAEYLSMDARLVPDEPQKLKGAARVAERVAQLGGNVYLSGTGARAYMDEDDAEFLSRDIRIRWSRHQHTTGDSILTALFDDKSPRDTVMKEVEL
jgi:hypothetical protein